MCKKIGVQYKSLQEAEHRIYSIKEELQQATSSLQNYDTVFHMFQDKLDDLKNHSRQNRLRIIGLS